MATYTGNHFDPNPGLKTLYVGYTASTLNSMLADSAKSATAGAYRAYVIYLNTPGPAGAPAGAPLSGSDANLPLQHRPVLDMQAAYGFCVVVKPGPNKAYISRVLYVAGTAVAPGTDTDIGLIDKMGTVLTAPGSLDLTGTRFAYRD
ncbi:hypothetical protein [Hymenobacter sp. IS2118]|uniref:hypothetical protein n=1 Tax=Hymenobacter sp. IS2118 TaxID=1505605 RepID=UPI000550A6D7|nr:hypothetical protein [Hymenobacter sp. IS2118]